MIVLVLVSEDDGDVDVDGRNPTNEGKCLLARDSFFVESYFEVWEF